MGLLCLFKSRIVVFNFLSMDQKFIIFILLLWAFAAQAQPGHDYYWVGTSANTVQGSGEWTDLNAWRLDSLNGAVPTQVPISGNHVFFMAGAFPTTLSGADSVIITVGSNANCNNFYWDNTIPTLSKKILFVSGAPGSTGVSNLNLDIYGNFELPTEDKLHFDFRGALRFRSEKALATLRCNGQDLLVRRLVFDGTDTTEFRLLDELYMDDVDRNHFSAYEASSGGFCYFYRGYLNFNGQTVTLDHFNASTTSFPARRLNIAGSRVNLIGHGAYIWYCNFAGGNFTSFDATGSHLIVREPTDRAYGQQLLLGTVAYDTITTRTKRNVTFRGGVSPTIQHLYLDNDAVFYDEPGAATTSLEVENLHLYGDHIYYFSGPDAQDLILENITVHAACDEFVTIMNRHGSQGRIVKKTPSTTLTLNQVILNGIEGDISNGQSYVANNSIDAGGNTNWTFSNSGGKNMRFQFSNPAATTHHWHVLANWQEWNGTAWVAATCLPTPLDNVNFDINSFPAIGNHSMRIDSSAYCHDMRWVSSIDNRITFDPHLNANGTIHILNVFGTMELDADLGMACSGTTFRFWGNGPDSIISNGIFIYNTIELQPYSNYRIIGDLTARYVLGLIQSTVAADNIRMNLEQLRVYYRQFDSVECHLTHPGTNGSFRDHGGYQHGISYTGTTTFHFWGTNQYGNCSQNANGNGKTYLLGSSCHSCTGGHPPAHFPNVIFHGELSHLQFHMTIHGDLTLLENGNFYYGFNSNSLFFKQIKVLGDQPNSPYQGDMNLTAGKSYTFDSDYANRYAPGHPNYQYNSKIEIAGTLNAIGTCQKQIVIETLRGNPMTLRAAAANIDYAIIQGMDNDSMPTITATNSVDLGGNSGINFATSTTGTTLYWRAHHSNPTQFVGAWNDPAHWTTNPANLVGDSACVPSIADTVIFDGMSYSVTSNGCFIDETSFCKTIWVQADVRLESTNLTIPTGKLLIGESLLIDVAMTQYRYTGELSFIGTNGVVKTSNTVLVNDYISFKNSSGRWDFVDDFTLENRHYLRHGRLELISGHLVTNNHTWTLYNGLRTAGSETRIIDLGTSTINLLCIAQEGGSNSNFPWRIGGANINILGQNSIMNFQNNTTTNYAPVITMGFDSLTYRTIRNNGSYDSNNITYGVVNFNSTNHVSDVSGIVNYQFVNFAGTANIRHDNMMDSVAFGGGHFYYLTANSIQYLKPPHGKIIANASGSNFVNIETTPSGQTSYFHKEWGDYFCLDYIKVKDNEGTRGINPNTSQPDLDLYFYTGTNSDNVNGTATGIWNFSLLFSTHTVQTPNVSACEGQDSVDISVSIIGNDLYDIRYSWYDSLGNTGADTVQLNDDDNDPNTPFVYTIRRPVLASGYYAFDVATFRCGKRTAPAIDTVWIYKNSPNTLVDANSTADCYLTNTGDWVDFYDDANGKPVLSIRDSLGTGDTDSLHQVNTMVFIEPTVQYYAGRPYLQRHWRITPSNNVGAKVRFYFTQEELDSLYSHTYHGYHGLGFDHSMMHLEVLKFDAVPHANATIGSSAPTVVPHIVIPLTGTNGKAFSSANAVLAIEFEVSSFSHFILVPTLPVFLPLDLLSFNATPVNNKEVNLAWEVEKTDDISHFEVFRSADAVHFESLEIVDATALTYYQLLDQEPLAGDNYYRLKIHGNNGEEKLSPIKVVRINSEHTWKVYPNPVHEGLLTLSFSSQDEAPLLLEIINPLGQVVKTENRAIALGQNILSIQLSDLPNGTYLLRAQQRGQLIGQEKIWKID